MRYSIAVKFIAIVLCAISLVAAVACGFGIVQVTELGLYTDGFDGWIENRLQWQAHDLAKDLVDRYAVRKLTNCPEEVLEEQGYWYVFEESIHWTGLDETSYDFVITDPEGEMLESAAGVPETVETLFDYQTACSVEYPVMVTDEEEIDKIYGTDYRYKKTVYLSAYDKKAVTIRYYGSPEYTVAITLDSGSMLDRSGTSLELVQMIYELRYSLMIVMAIALVILGAGLVYLCCAAGKTQAGQKARPGGLNLLPLDVYAAAGTGAGIGLGALTVQLVEHWIFKMDNLNPGTLMIVGLVLLAVALICVGFYFAICAQLKMKAWYWWKHSFLGWLTAKLWQGMKLAWQGMKLLAELLPVIWRYVLIGGLMGVGATVAALLVSHISVWPLLAVIVICAAVVVYGGFSYGILLRGAEKMAGGDLDSRIDTRFLLGDYAKCAKYLNALADVAILAAQKQMRSERMKTELITNVSHDIKTPLTSIINYVDILQNAKTPEDTVQYLEVLGRQSQRLKKLIDDLMEMSKASTGNIAVDLIQLDPVETVNQALGEFSDKLDAGGLTVVFQPPQEPMEICADGRLTWRVLSNLLSNIVKYALPGTRVYADVTSLEDKVLISLKNISREPLNVSADELTERFVRGDTSRNTEGSGLGLNIAKSLMELQKGQLELLVDGDLFKVTLIFPSM